MSAIKLHLAREELAALERAAARLDVDPEDVIYVALDRLMLELNDAAIRADTVRGCLERDSTLARWSDNARSVHIYESQPDDESRQSGYLRLSEW